MSKASGQGPPPQSIGEAYTHFQANPQMAQLMTVIPIGAFPVYRPMMKMSDHVCKMMTQMRSKNPQCALYSVHSAPQHAAQVATRPRKIMMNCPTLPHLSWLHLHLVLFQVVQPDCVDHRQETGCWLPLVSFSTYQSHRVKNSQLPSARRL